MSVEWNGDEIMADMTADVDKRIGAAAAYFHGELLKVLSKSYPPPSVPGEAPHGRTWNLRNKVTLEWVAGQLVARVGVREGGEYGFFLEMGTRYIRPRPWFFSTLDTVRPVLTQILGG